MNTKAITNAAPPAQAQAAAPCGALGACADCNRSCAQAGGALRGVAVNWNDWKTLLVGALLVALAIYLLDRRKKAHRRKRIIARLTEGDAA